MPYSAIEPVTSTFRWTPWAAYLSEYHSFTRSKWFLIHSETYVATIVSINNDRLSLLLTKFSNLLLLDLLFNVLIRIPTMEDSFASSVVYEQTSQLGFLKCLLQLYEAIILLLVELGKNRGTPWSVN